MPRPAPPRLVVLALLALPGALAACGDDPAPPAAIELPPAGPLAGPAGAGSFRLGVATAATQIEDGNTATDWYVWTRPVAEGGLGKGTFVGDAVQGYTRVLEDLDLVAGLGVDSYRFSIEWARVEPVRDQIDEAALAHYRAQLEAMRARGLRPLVTLHHFSNPVWVADPRASGCPAGPTDANLCGFGSAGGPQIIEEMRAHAALIAARFGDLVDDWGTVNEPLNYILAGYGLGAFPPGKTTLLTSLPAFVAAVRDYAAGHAAMYHAVKAADTVDADGDGAAASVGLSMSVARWEPARANRPSTDPDDVAAVARLEYLMHYLFVDAARTGAWDADADGTPDEQHPEWAGTLDWLGVQYYFRAGASADRPLIAAPVALTPCFGGFDNGACLPALDPTYCVPTMGYEGWTEGVESVLRAFAARYPDVPLLVSEAGIAAEEGARRAENVVRVLESIAKVRAEGADIRGYYHWSLTDNFEWAEGYAPRFGLFAVDAAAGDYARTETAGATVLREIATTRAVSAALRTTYGGTGPMTPERVTTDEFCTKLVE